jgi:hypothetical protein
MKFVLTLVLGTILSIMGVSAVLADSDHGNAVESGSALVESKISCPNLTVEELESIGEYYMEQMHPGSQHEAMDNMMGGEGSESLRQAHIFMARRWYCGDAAGMGMMGAMMGNSIVPVVSESKSNNFSGGMMGSGSYWSRSGSIMQVLGLIFLLVGIAAFAKYLVKK